MWCEACIYPCLLAVIMQLLLQTTATPQQAQSAARHPQQAASAA
jgi:hypothetical protein